MFNDINNEEQMNIWKQYYERSSLMYLGPMMTHFKQSMIGTMMAQQWPKACIMYLKYSVPTLSQLTVYVMPMLGHFWKIVCPTASQTMCQCWQLSTFYQHCSTGQNYVAPTSDVDGGPIIGIWWANIGPTKLCYLGCTQQVFPS